MSTLRARTIRLAFANPDLQPLLLPILAEDAPARVAARTNGKGTAGFRGKLRGDAPPPPAKPAKKPVSSTAIRSGYYESGDKIGALESAVLADPATKGDKALVKAVADLQKAHEAVFAALKPYSWD